MHFAYATRPDAPVLRGLSLEARPERNKETKLHYNMIMMILIMLLIITIMIIMIILILLLLLMIMIMIIQS